MDKISLNGINSQVNLRETKSEKENKPQTEAKPQLKEHCSSKVANALKGVALGVILATGIATGAKAAPIKTNSNNMPDNQTSVSQQAEVAVASTEIEAAVDEAMNKETSDLYTGYRVSCEGEMTEGDRNYKASDISDDGILTFYDVSRERASNNLSKANKYKNVYEAVNSFDLETKAENNSAQVKIGQKFEETTAKNGDYVELAEDGKTFNVYDENGNFIGSCTYKTEEERNNANDNFNKGIAGIAVGTLGVMGSAVGVLIHEVNKDGEKQKGD